MATLKRKATARWEGDLKNGRGSLSMPQSGVFDAQAYSFHTRFGDAKGTNPEELLAAAHAGCFAMALSLVLQEAGHVAERLDAEAVAHLATGDGPPTVAKIVLTLRGRVPGLDAAEFVRHADNAKRNCVISRALSVPVELDAALEG